MRKKFWRKFENVICSRDDKYYALLFLHPSKKIPEQQSSNFIITTANTGKNLFYLINTIKHTIKHNSLFQSTAHVVFRFSDIFAKRIKRTLKRTAATLVTKLLAQQGIPRTNTA